MARNKKKRRTKERVEKGDWDPLKGESGETIRKMEEAAQIEPLEENQGGC